MSVQLCVLKICLTLIVLSVEGRPSNPFITYDKAKDVWTKRSCIFPDPANYKTPTSLLEPCNVTNNSTVIESSVETVCEAFFRLSIQMCYATSPNKEYVASKLKPEILEQFLDFTDDDVCQYASNLNFSALPYLEELRNYTQCSQHCLNSALHTKPICQLLISALCSFFGKNMCQPGKKYPIAEPTSNLSRTKASLVTSTPPTSEKNNTSDPTQQKSTGKESEGITLTADDDATEKVTVGVPVSAAIQTAKSTPDKTTVKYDPNPSQKLPVGDVEPNPKSTEKSEGKGTAARVRIGESDDEDKENEEEEDTGRGRPKGEEEEDTGRGRPKGEEEEDTGRGTPKGEEEEDTGRGTPKGEEEEDTGRGTPKGEEVETDQDSKDEKVKNKISGTGDGGKAQGSRENGENKDTNQTAEEEEESTGSGHFLAYFLTAVVICIAGYIIYHNKQKIMAFVIEGRSNHSGRQRSKGVKYTELKSNVEEVLPSLEKSATAKNFVY